MQTFLQAVNEATDMPEMWKEHWRGQCWEHYHDWLIRWAKEHSLQNEQESVEAMEALCDGKSAETLEGWCIGLWGK